jgi:hypothetical protein
VIVVTEAQDLAHLLGRSRQHDGKRETTIGSECISLEGAPPLLIGDQNRLRNEFLKLSRDVGPPRDNRGIRSRHGQLRHQRFPHDKNWKIDLFFRTRHVGGQYALERAPSGLRDLRLIRAMVSQVATFRGKLKFLLGQAKSKI